jgi:peptidoglycan biosynthesis protein MviN/MurJ (putative lipid II flippase)
MFNSALFLLCYLVNTRFAAGMADGTVSAFFYADRLYEPLTTTLVYSVSIVLFPKFSQQYEEMEHTQYRQYVVHVLKNTLLLVLPVSLLFTAFGTPVIRVLFEGGSFTAQDTLLCGGIFSMYALGMAGFFMLDILNKAYYAMGKTLVPLCVTAGVLAFSFGCNALCARLFPQRPELLALGTALGFLLGGCGMYIGFSRTEGVKMPWKQLFWGVVCSLITGGAAFLLYDRLVSPDAAKLALVAQCVAIGGVAMVLYLIAMGPMVPTKEILSKLRRNKG